eukprot:GEMP01063028.1.p1 GENE.GEMP01063028.1~~GEMP01063028.1.p1  ORF type:complete len:180 (+),score=46.15 GEMP01063028.1:129-668(+)
MSNLRLREHVAVCEEACEKDGVSLSRRQESLKKVLGELQLVPDDQGSVVKGSQGDLHNQCLFLALGSVLNMDPLVVKRKIESNVAKTHPEWLQGGLHQEAVSDYLAFSLKGDLAHIAVCVFDATMGTAEIYKGAHATDVVSIYFTPGHYMGLKARRKHSIAELTNVLLRWFVHHVVIDV